MTALLFIVSLLIVVAASELFTNAVEWAGYRLGLGSGATGSLLASLGTALPETVVPVVALIGRQRDADQVAMGAVIGAPFLLLTLGMAVTGIAVWLRRDDPVLHGNPAQLRRDLGTYLAGAALLTAALVMPLGLRIVVGILLLAVYARHVVSTLGGDGGGDAMPEPLHLTRWRPGNPPLAAIAVQLVAAVGLLIVGADLFVQALQDTAGALHIGALVLAVVLVPVATELPETLNSVLWIRSRDDELAIGNVAGATAFQACIPGFIGVCFTPWRPGAAGLINGGLAVVTALVVLLLLHDGTCRGRRLMLCAIPWIGYVALVLAIGGRLGSASG